MSARRAWGLSQAAVATEPTATVDAWVLGSALALTALGVAMVFSASIPLSAARESGDIFYYLKREILFLVVGLAGMVAAARTSMGWFRHKAIAIFIVTLVALAGLFVAGVRVNGALSWYVIFGFSFQPSEMAKIGLVIVTAHHFSRFPQGEPTFSLAARPFVMLGAAVGLIAIQPDMGTAAVIVASVFIYFHIAGARLRHLGAAGALASLPVLLMFKLHPYQWQRIRDFFWGNESTALAGGWQGERSLIALGSGGLTGSGYCGSVEKYFYLPAATTDSILAVVGEELGILFTWGVLVLFAILVWRGMHIARRAPDRFSGLVAAGVVCSLCVQALLNTAVVTCCVPATGVPLPFVSYGGSSLLFSLIGVGLLLNVSKSVPRRVGWVNGRG